MSGGGEHVQVFAVIRLELFSLHEEPELSVKVVDPSWANLLRTTQSHQKVQIGDFRR
jgi:hypothetical protein